MIKEYKEKIKKNKLFTIFLAIVLIAGMFASVSALFSPNAFAASTEKYVVKRYAQSDGSDAGYSFTGKSGVISGAVGTCMQPGKKYDSQGKKHNAKVERIPNTHEIARVAYYCYKKGYKATSTKKLYGKPRTGVIAHALAHARYKTGYKTSASLASLEKTLKNQGWNSTSMKAYKKLYNAAIKDVGKNDVPATFEVYFLDPTSGRQDGVVWKYVPPGKVELTKSIDKDHTLYLSCSGYKDYSGIKYTLYKSDKKTQAGVFNLNKSGKATISNLPEGTYYAKETTTNKYYKMDSKWYSVIIKSKQTTSLKVTDPPETGVATIIKKEKEGNPIPVGSKFTFKLTNTQNSKINYLITVSGNGSSTAEGSKEVAAGTYSVQETAMFPEGEWINDTGTGKVTVAPKSTGTITWTNKKLEEGKLYVTKETEDDGPLNGFKFRVEGELFNNGTMTKDRIITVADPKVELKEENKNNYENFIWDVDETDLKTINDDAEERKTGSYDVKLTGTAKSKTEGVDDLTVTITVKVNLEPTTYNTTENKYENKIDNKESKSEEKEFGTVSYSDFDWYGSATKYKDVNTGEEFTILTTDKTGNGYVQGANKTGITKGIYYGHYTVTEELTEEQARRYKTPEVKTGDIIRNDSNIMDPLSFEFTNEAKWTDVELVKTSPDNAIEGLKFKVTGTTVFGEEVEKEGVTDENGKIEFGKIYAGHYVMEEVSFDSKNYINTYPLEGHDKPAIEFDVTGEEEEPVSIEFKNKPITKLYLTKIDGDTFDFLENAEFELFGDDESVAKFRIFRNQNNVADVEMIEAKEGITGSIVKQDDIDELEGNTGNNNADMLFLRICVGAGRTPDTAGRRVDMPQMRHAPCA